ncbi:phospholipase D-like domain-containing protein [Halovenus halobia]|uniref:phospholipase D-like domain-containing protein n=1 Tax=Halovenus halobia TaxID=3396622 RepID=UPI003F578DBD
MAVTATPPATATNTGNTTAQPQIVEVYPNPVADEDDGEFVTVKFPEGIDLRRYALIDETEPVSLAAVVERDQLSAPRRITLSTDPAVTERLTNRTVQELPDRVRMANSGDDIRLLRDSTVIQRVSYESADSAERYLVRSREWRPLRGSNFSITTATGGTVEAFVLPDNPTRAVEFLDSADNRISLGGYTLSSEAVVDTLLAARKRGVEVTLLLDGSPVSGLSTSAANALSELSRAGVDLRVIDGPRARVRFHHAKYAIVDQRALITTENWKPSGLGGHSSRGWAVITRQQRIVRALNQTFHSDRGWVDAKNWQSTAKRGGEEKPPTTDYPTNFSPTSFEVEQTALLLAPDNAERRLRKLLANASEQIRIEQMSINPAFPLLEAVLAAARRGVEVKILLSGAWYVEDENNRLARNLNERADVANLPLSVRVANPQDRYEKIHAKGLIVDGETTVVGSLNWNNNSFRHNREVALLIDSKGVAGYYGHVFASDWAGAAPESESRRVPVGLLGAVAIMAVLTAGGTRKIRFESQSRGRG